MAKVFPLVSYTGWKPNAHIYRKVIASTEVTCGAILVLIPGSTSLHHYMLNNGYIHYMWIMFSVFVVD